MATCSDERGTYSTFRCPLLAYCHLMWFAFHPTGIQSLKNSSRDPEQPADSKLPGLGTVGLGFGGI